MNRELAQRNRDRKSRGQSLVEFALVLPLLAVIILGALDLGRAFFTYIIVTNAAREGARYGTTWFDDDYSDNIDGIKDSAAGEASASGITLTIYAIDNTNCPPPSGGTFTCDLGGVIVSCPDGDGDKKCDHSSIEDGSYKALSVTVEHDFNPILGYLFGASIPISREVEMLFP